MHRSASYLAAVGGMGVVGTVGVAPRTSIGGSGVALDHLEQYNLPTYDPQSDAAKKEASRVHLSESLVHLIPIVVILCGFLLWSFSSSSHASEAAVMVETRGGTTEVIARVKNSALNEGSWNGTGMMTGMEDLDPIDGAHMTGGVEDTTGTGRELGAKEPQD